MEKDTAGLIYKKMSAIMADVEAIGKDKTNQQQGFKYRGIDDVMNNLHSIMSKHGVFVLPMLIDGYREDKVSAKGNALIYSICDYDFTFYAEDGSSVSARVRGEGMDSGDKASNKSIAVAFKYALLQAFMIPTEELSDPDAETHQVAPVQTIDDKLKALPEEVRVYLKQNYNKKSDMVEWCNSFGWGEKAMLEAVIARQPDPEAK